MTDKQIKKQKHKEREIAKLMYKDLMDLQGPRVPWNKKIWGFAI